jgi:hypothetical protein
MSTFAATQDTLANLIAQVGNGQIQLPEFQRGWVWDDSHIIAVITSVARSFPIGAIMTLETGGEVKFAPRYVEGANLPLDAKGFPTIQPGRLLLDGQQRLTSMFQALTLPQAIVTKDDKGKRSERFYYVDIAKALGSPAEREEAVFSVPKDRRITRDFGRDVRLDLSTPEQEYSKACFPMNKVFAPNQWFSEWMKHWAYDPARIEQFNTFRSQFLDVFQTFLVPVIQLSKTASKEAVCRVFEKVNTGGVPLTAFELVTATYAADGYDLRADWFGPKSGPEAGKGRWQRLVTSGPTYAEKERDALLAAVEPNDFLQCVSLLHTQDVRQRHVAEGKAGQPPAISCTRQSILDMKLDAYEAWSARAEAGFKRAREFLWTERIYSSGDLPYRTQLVPLAAIIATLDGDWHNGAVRERVANWFWCGVFGELYGGAIETRFARDLPEVAAWARGVGPTPQTVEDCNPVTERLRSLRSRQSAAYKGLHALIMRVGGAADWLAGAPMDEASYFQKDVDIHHVFPEAWCKKQNIPPTTYNSIVNKTGLTATTNRILQGHAPSLYLKRIEDKTGFSSAKVNDLLRSHLIEPHLLRANDVAGMMVARAARLVDEIQKATGRKVGGPPVAEVFGLGAAEADADEMEDAA